LKPEIIVIPASKRFPVADKGYEIENLKLIEGNADSSYIFKIVTEDIYKNRAVCEESEVSLKILNSDSRLMSYTAVKDLIKGDMYYVVDALNTYDYHTVINFTFNNYNINK
jgi:hypothetical protein